MAFVSQDFETSERSELSFRTLLRSEVRSSPFSLQESEVGVLDVQKTFAPRPTLSTGLVKLLLAGLTLSSLAYSLVEDFGNGDRYFFLAYGSNWNLILASTYLLFSLLCVLLRSSSLLQQPAANVTDRPSWLVQLTWMLGSIAFPCGILVGTLYWSAEYDPDENDISYSIFLNHVVVPASVAVDYVFVNNIPLRLSHIFFLGTFVALYLGWLAAFAYTDLENPTISDNDDYIYEALQWKEKQTRTIIYYVLIVLVYMPVVFFVCWIFSQIAPAFAGFNVTRRRMYHPEDEQAARRGSKNGMNLTKNDDDDEEDGRMYEAQVE